MLRRSLLILSILLFSCTTTEVEEVRARSVLQLLESDEESDWLSALESIVKTRGSFENLLRIYLNRKYEPIKERVFYLFVDYIRENGVDAQAIGAEVDTREKFEDFFRLTIAFSDEDTLNYAESVYLKEDSELRSQEVEYLGRYMLTVDSINTLYGSEENRVKVGTIKSAGFMSGYRIRQWLATELFNSNEEISSSALFSLSKHGTPGFELIGDNLSFLPQRLKLIAIDILVINSVEKSYSSFADLLLSGDKLIEERILNAYRNIGKRGEPYIYQALVKGHRGVTLELLKILEEKKDGNYLNSVEFLLAREDLQDYLIRLAFEREAWSFLKRQLLNNNYNMEKLIIDYAIDIDSPFLFMDSSLREFSIFYFLDNLSFNIVLSYFISQDFDDNFINDYVLIESINNYLNFISEFETSRSEDPVVASYFELTEIEEENRNYSESFFLGMENWLKTGDESYLKESNRIKEARFLGVSELKKQRLEFMEEIEDDYRDSIIRYEASKNGILSSYRQMTYRLKFLAQKTISEKGYSELIQD